MESTIAVVVLTLNEEASLAGCLESLRDIGPLVVVDSGSTDNTASIAASMGAIVLEHVQDGPFLISDQRNWAVENCPVKSDWVLFLDADERSTPEFARSVLEAIHAAPDSHGFFAAPAFIYQGKWIRRVSGYPNWHPRMVRRVGGARFVGGVWETFSDDAKIGRITAPYRHYPDDKGLASWVDKHLRYAQFEARQVALTASGSQFDSARRRRSRAIRYRLGPLRKYLSIAYLAIIRRGVLDGPAGWSYLRRMFLYEMLIDEFISEDRFIQIGRTESRG